MSKTTSAVQLVRDPGALTRALKRLHDFFESKIKSPLRRHEHYVPSRPAATSEVATNAEGRGAAAGAGGTAMSRAHKTSRGPRRPGWPKLLKCLRCDVPRLASGPEDRLHVRCRAEVAQLDGERGAPSVPPGSTRAD